MALEYSQKEYLQNNPTHFSRAVHIIQNNFFKKKRFTDNFSDKFQSELVFALLLSLVCTHISSLSLSQLICFNAILQRENSGTIRHNFSREAPPTIPDKIFGTKWNNPVKLDREAKFGICFCVFFNCY